MAFTNGAQHSLKNGNLHTGKFEAYIGFVHTWWIFIRFFSFFSLEALAEKSSREFCTIETIIRSSYSHARQLNANLGRDTQSKSKLQSPRSRFRESLLILLSSTGCGQRWLLLLTSFKQVAKAPLLARCVVMLEMGSRQAYIQKQKLSWLPALSKTLNNKKMGQPKHKHNQ
jgi:hypothetical protein